MIHTVMYIFKIFIYIYFYDVTNAQFVTVGFRENKFPRT